MASSSAKSISSGASPRPAFKLKAIEQVDENLFVVHATLRRKRVLKKHRTMVVIRDGERKRDLTLINPVQLDRDGERKLRMLGSIRRLIRLSSSPHQDAYDDYYQRKYLARVWSPEVYQRQCQDGFDKAIKSPVAHSEVFLFQDTLYPEAVLVLDRGVGKILVSSQALQHQRDNPFITGPSWTLMQVKGLFEDLVVVSPAWLKVSSPKKGTLREDFERLLRLDFDQVIGASGTLLPVQGKEAVVIAIERAFPVWYD